MNVSADVGVGVDVGLDVFCVEFCVPLLKNLEGLELVWRNLFETGKTGARAILHG